MIGHNPQPQKYTILYLHGNPYEDRKVILSQELLDSNAFNPVTIVKTADMITTPVSCQTEMYIIFLTSCLVYRYLNSDFSTRASIDDLKEFSTKRNVFENNRFYTVFLACRALSPPTGPYSRNSTV
jgi:hypothetical protein